MNKQADKLLSKLACSSHREEELVPLRDGWFCESCGKIVIKYSEWPGPNERVSDDINLSELPTFLSAKIIDADGEDHEVVRLWSLCEIVEILLRILTAIGVADIEAQHGELPDEVARTFLEGDRISRPTLGDWFQLFSAVASNFPENTIAPELRACLEDVLRPLFNGIYSLRNNLAHGGGFNRYFAKSILGTHVRLLRESLGKLSWLGEFEFVVKCGSDEIVLRGPVIQSPTTSIALEMGDSSPVYVRRGSQSLSIWPICAWLIPIGEKGATPSLYVRKNRKRLEHLPIKNPFGFTELGGEAFKKFRQLFRLEDHHKLLGILDDFEAEIQNDASRIIGRQKEINLLVELIDTSDRPGILWIEGKPGIGKSALIAKLAQRVKSSTQDLVLLWRFQAGDPRCTRSHFLKYCIEQLSKKLQNPVEPSGDDPDVLLAELTYLFRLNDKFRIISIVDGLDELERSDPNFLDFPFVMKNPQTLWICAGRPTLRLRNIYTEDKCKHVFSDNGLRPLNREDISEWLKTTIPEGQRAQLIKGEEEWIDEVALKSEGVPQYIQLLLQDIELDKIRVGSILPKGLEQYWNKLLFDIGIDDVNTILPKVIMAIALSVEAPTAEFLIEILVASGELPEEPIDRHLPLMEKVLEGARNLMRIEASPVGGEDRYYPLHESLRDHLKTSPAIANTATVVGQAIHRIVSDPTRCVSRKACCIAFMSGIRQLIVDEALQDAKSLITDFGYLFNRILILSQETSDQVEVSDLLADYRLILENATDPDLDTFYQFIRRNQHKIIDGGATMLFQLFMNQPSGSRFKRIAAEWAIRSAFREPWLELVAFKGIETLPAVMTVNYDSTISALAIGQGHIVVVSPYRDATVLSPETGAIMSRIQRCRGTVARFSTEGRLLVGSGNVLKIWEVDSAGHASFLREETLPGTIDRLLDTGKGENIITTRMEDHVQVWMLDAKQTIADYAIPLTIELTEYPGDSRSDIEYVLPLPNGGGVLISAKPWGSFNRLMKDGELQEKGVKGIPRTAVLDWASNRLWFLSMGMLMCMDTNSITVVDHIKSKCYLFAHQRAAGSSLESQIMAFGATKDLVVFDIQNRRSTVVPGAHSYEIARIAISLDGKMVVTADEHSEPQLRVWDTDQLLQAEIHGNIEEENQDQRPVKYLKIDPNSDQVLCIYLNGAVQIFEHGTGNVIRAMDRIYYLNKLAPDDCHIDVISDLSYLAIAKSYHGCDDICEIDLRTGECSIFTPSPEQLPLAGEFDVDGLWYSSGGNVLHVQIEGGPVISWDTRTKLPLLNAEQQTAPQETINGARLLWISPELFPPEEYLVTDYTCFVDIVEGVIEGSKVDEICSTRWVHDRPITAADVAIDGRVVLGDDQGNVIFLRRRQGRAFRAQIV